LQEKIHVRSSSAVSSKVEGGGRDI
jgi:hypothetical protein